MNTAQAMQAVEQRLADAVTSDVDILRDASKHILSAGGKRIRPRLTLLSYAAAGGTQWEDVIPVAAAVELVHTASVVHDDINDHGMMRRGRPSVNSIWGRTFALLTGDFLFTKVYELMAPFKDLNVILARGTVALVEGETLQASAAKEGNLSREIYYRIIGLKTAALFQSGAEMGATMAGAPSEQVEALSQYAYNIGLAFQIVDDILDLIADSAQLGKTAGIDVAQGKGVGTMYATNGGNEAVAVAEAPSDPLTAIKQKILQGDAINQARAQARYLVQDAIKYLDVLPESAAKTELIEIANLVVDRDH
jgi:octaprenyl-diphosphate synthase